MSDKRKTFYLNSDKEKPVTAGGVIIYRFVAENVELLLADTRGNFEDLGGRADQKDDDIVNTVAREAYEESNKILSKKEIMKRLNEVQPIYIEKTKYALFIIPALEKEVRLVGSDFGDREIHDDIERTIKWIPLAVFLLPEIIKNKLNWRLKSKQVFDRLKALKPGSNTRITIDVFKTPSSKSTSTISTIYVSSTSNDEDSESEDSESMKPKKVSKTKTKN